MLFFFFRRRKKKQPFENESVSAFQTFPEKKKNKLKKKQLLEKKNRTKISKMGGKWEIGSLVPWSFSKTAYYRGFSPKPSGGGGFILASSKILKSISFGKKIQAHHFGIPYSESFMKIFNMLPRTCNVVEKSVSRLFQTRGDCKC